MLTSMYSEICNDRKRHLLTNCWKCLPETANIVWQPQLAAKEIYKKKQGLLHCNHPYKNAATSQHRCTTTVGAVINENCFEGISRLLKIHQIEQVGCVSELSRAPFQDRHRNFSNWCILGWAIPLKWFSIIMAPTVCILLALLSHFKNQGLWYLLLWTLLMSM